ncbi:MAG: indolepyruvate ferredoxin oxidoreductase subunit alpha [Candidatus Omnitrophica bacterium]|nr:indolepyruvate ferredoxin oxidoreductase subunit alpha [Candidatus Omnitrophota bacterium]
MMNFLSGNEAIAAGAYEFGVSFAAGYPGTPSTEILETISQYPEIDSQWAVNEKVALDVAIGASLGGIRSLAAMKHVGLNVASDTLMTLSYTGVHAGLIVVTVDDPNMNSSQNEQDNRNYAKFAKIPLLEPSDSQEAKDFIRLALRISESFDTPVLLRLTARVAHSKTVVKINPKTRKVKRMNPCDGDSAKYVMIPSNAKKRRIFVDQRSDRLKRFSDKTPVNRIEWGEKNFGIITSGISYHYTMEVCPDQSILKLGMTYPLPTEKIKEFTKALKNVYVIEELDPFLQEQLGSMGIKTTGKEVFPSTGELSPDIICRGLSKKGFQKTITTRRKWPFRAPLLCAGCSYLGLFYILKKLGMIVLGDIGCYSLCAQPPLSALHTCISMGSGIGIAQGYKKALKQNGQKKKVIAVIGDSTFIHSGITPLIDLIYNKEPVSVIILDNGGTAMTGCQGHPGTGITLKNGESPKVNYEQLVKSLGIKRVIEMNSYNLGEVRTIIKKESVCQKPSVIIAKGLCLLVAKGNQYESFKIIPSRCTKCGECLLLSCPAIAMGRNQYPRIDEKLCTGCSLCQQICMVQAIEETQGVQKIC